jgi:hypothetical protein
MDKAQKLCNSDKYSCITQPPYSPYLAPGEFWLSPIPKIGLNGHTS